MNLYDVCVLGAGPAGITSAIELAERGLKVILVESGGELYSSSTQKLSDAEIVTPHSHEIMGNAVQRGLGGTSALWGGRCVPLDSIDFEVRDFMDGSGWPFESDELAPYYPRACEILGVGDFAFEVDGCQYLSTKDKHLSARFTDTENIRATQLERWSRSPNIWGALKNKVEQHPNITVQSGLTCVGFRQEKLDAPVTEALVMHTLTMQSEPISVKARVYVIACGGVESTRLILNSVNDSLGLKLQSTHFLGHYYMGHPSGKIADIELFGDPKETIYGFEVDNGVYVRRRITFQPDTLRKEKLLNIAFWLDNPTMSDWRHGSGVLSAAYLLLTTNMIGKFLAPAAIRKRIVGTYDSKILRHLMNCLRSPLGTLFFCTKFFWQRYLTKPRLPGFFTYCANNRYALHYHAEQMPNWNSVISLSDDIDSLGQRRAKITLEWAQQDIDSIIRAHRLLDKTLQDNAIGRLKYRLPLEKLNESIVDQAVDGLHQIGTLRMALDSSCGVTDSYGRLFGVQNVFVASSAIFPTSGQANPTLSLVALAVRQAEFISRTIKRKADNA